MSRLAAFSTRDAPGTEGETTSPAAYPRTTLALQLLLVLLVVRAFGIAEQRGLFALLIVAGIGWLLAARGSAAHRSRCLLASGLVGLPVALAWSLSSVLDWPAALRLGAMQSAWVLGTGSVLIGLCHLPIASIWRVALVVLAGGGLVAWRTADGSLFWPILGSMFMFRLWVYLRAERARLPASLSQRLSYFFMLPNFFFPFFPIVDYRTWITRAGDDSGGLVAQRGIAFITRGLMHVLCYRLLSALVVPASQDLANVWDVVVFLAGNYGLYLRISGHFHIITGIVMLFGIDLPRTHDWYFLASNPSDIWRRINIYWKDFLSAHVFMPAYFTLRMIPRGAAIALAVLLTFAATWILHSWQAFWLLGNFPLSAGNAMLWLSAGVIVAASSLWQYRRARQARPRPETLILAGAFAHVLAILGTFALVSFFWACWTDPLFPQRVRDIAAVGGFSGEPLTHVLTALAAIVGIGTCVQFAVPRVRASAWWKSAPSALTPDASPRAGLVFLAVLLLVGVPPWGRLAGEPISRVANALHHARPSPLEASRLAAGYYEQLAEANLQTEALLGSTGVAPPRVRQNYFDATRRTTPARQTELIPGWEGTIKGAPFKVNRWGMRDKNVALPKPPDTYRVAVLGSSVTLGLGVRAEEDFESLLETRFNEASADRKYEFLNFAVGSYYALHSLSQLRERAIDFEPDGVIYVAHQGEFEQIDEHLAAMYLADPSLLSDCLRDVIRRAGVTPDDSPGMVQIRLASHGRRIADCAYQAIVRECRAHEIRPIFVYIPVPNAPSPGELNRQILALAHQAGFEVIDLSDWLETRNPNEFALTPDDYHVNAAGHARIAELLWDDLAGLRE